MYIWISPRSSRDINMRYPPFLKTSKSSESHLTPTVCLPSCTTSDCEMDRQISSPDPSGPLGLHFPKGKVLVGGFHNSVAWDMFIVQNNDRAFSLHTHRQTHSEQPLSLSLTWPPSLRLYPSLQSHLRNGAEDSFKVDLGWSFLLKWFVGHSLETALWGK
jgi:hypothetical protein